MRDRNREVQMRERDREVQMRNRNREVQRRRLGRALSEDPPEGPAPNEMGDLLRQYVVENGPQKCPDGLFPRSDKSKRWFAKAYCFCVLSNGEKV